MAWVAIVPAAGSGTRLRRGEPKALVSLGGRPLLAASLELLRSSGVGRMVVAGPPERLAEVRALLLRGEEAVPGGATRAESVRRAFASLAPAQGDVVCIHDAARPLVTASEAAEVMRAAEATGAAIAATPIVDTVKRIEKGRIVATIDRAGLWAAATPQAFREEILRRALALEEEATDEAALCERLGIPVAIAPISRLAFKITTPEDLELAEAVFARRSA
ncbi:MAG: 2-C-methyl-D-erythritol 4-phosphate cytidylyltransferase [Acidobacteriota bacterium]|nr:2-C-methyl-D-erythritol 4-phosphate cytidylyltransferase [Acidobacteriota bacterium]